VFKVYNTVAAAKQKQIIKRKEFTITQANIILNKLKMSIIMGQSLTMIFLLAKIMGSGNLVFEQ
jgi:hypothetical protein